MRNELLLLIKKDTDPVIEQTKKIPQATLEGKLNEQKDTFLFTPPSALQRTKILVSSNKF